MRKKFEEDYEKSKNFTDMFGNKKKIKEELNVMARNASKNLGEEKTSGTPQTPLEKFIVEQVNQVFSLLDK